MINVQQITKHIFQRSKLWKYIYITLVNNGSGWNDDDIIIFMILNVVVRGFEVGRVVEVVQAVLFLDVKVFESLFWLWQKYILKQIIYNYLKLKKKWEKESTKLWEREVRRSKGIKEGLAMLTERRPVQLPHLTLTTIDKLLYGTFTCAYNITITYSNDKEIKPSNFSMNYC